MLRQQVYQCLIWQSEELLQNVSCVVAQWILHIGITVEVLLQDMIG